MPLSYNLLIFLLSYYSVDIQLSALIGSGERLLA
jgi:hypothetical protein